MTRNITFAIITSLAAAFAAIGHAADKPENDALSAVNVKIPLTQVIAAAEQYADGRAVQASFEHNADGAVYGVEVVSHQQAFDVAASDGRIPTAKADTADHEGGSDNEGYKDRN